MKRRQTFLKPGVYHGHVVTKKMIEDHVRGTKEMIASGYAPMLFLEHPPKGSDEGSPKKRDIDIQKLRGAAGWLEDVSIGDDGAAEYVLNVTDSEIDRKIEEGSIRFTSPELRPAYRVGEKVFENVFAHVALTHQPRNTDQSELAAMQFSLADWEPLQMSADEEKERENDQPKADPPTPDPSGQEENPDMPEGSKNNAQQAQRLQAILGHLAEIGIALPSDTPNCEIDVVLDRVLTGLMTYAEAQKMAKQEESVENENGMDGGQPPVIEQAGMLQYSLSDVDSIENKLLARVIRAEHESLKLKLDGMVSSGKLTPAAREKFLGSDAVQFSVEGDFVETMSIKQVVEVLDECLPDGVALEPEQFSIAQHHDGDQHYSGDGSQVSEAEAIRIVEEQAKKHPGLFK